MDKLNELLKRLGLLDLSRLEVQARLIGTLEAKVEYCSNLTQTEKTEFSNLLNAIFKLSNKNMDQGVRNMKPDVTPICCVCGEGPLPYRITIDGKNYCYEHGNKRRLNKEGLNND